MIISRITDHIEITKSRLPEQDKESNNIVKFQNAFASQWQEIENLLWDIHAQRDVMSATKKSLDFLGSIVGETRNYREDESYRLAILQKIIQNNTHGTPEEIIAIVAFFASKSEVLPNGYKGTNIYERINLIEWDYKSFIIELASNITITQVSLLKQIISISKPTCIAFLGIVLLPLEKAIIFDEIQNVYYDYVVGKGGVLLDTNYSETENTLETLKAQGGNDQLPGLSDWDLANTFTEKGYLAELMD